MCIIRIIFPILLTLVLISCIKSDSEESDTNIEPVITEGFTANKKFIESDIAGEIILVKSKSVLSKSNIGSSIIVFHTTNKTANQFKNNEALEKLTYSIIDGVLILEGATTIKLIKESINNETGVIMVSIDDGIDNIKYSLMPNISLKKSDVIGKTISGINGEYDFEANNVFKNNGIVGHWLLNNGFLSITEKDANFPYTLVLFNGNFKNSGLIYYTKEQAWGFYAVKKL